MNAAFGLEVPWWSWALMITGAIAIVSVFAALFLPDWPTPDFHATAEAEPGSEDFLRVLSGFLNVPVLRGGSAELLQNGDAFYPAMLEAIRAARESVHFQVYIFDPDEIGRPFLDAFAERARAGVEVRVMLDGFGSYRIRRRIRDELRAAGVRIELFRPLRLRHLARIFKRDHRRAIVIDGRVAFTGGAAVSRKWKGNVRNEHEWRDSMTRLTGPLARGVQTAFAENWIYCTGELVTGPRYYPEPGPADGPCGVALVSSPADSAQPIRLLLWLSFTNARRRLWISSSYFIPDRQLRAAVIERARAGVDVRILVPGNHTDAVPVQAAGRSYYEELLTAGVRVYEYRPAMMHAKTVVVDGAWSIVGSSNMDERSMELNEENMLGIADAAFARTAEDGLEADFARSKEILLDDWRQRGLLQRGFERVAKALIEQY